jgi:hypothetical protein
MSGYLSRLVSRARGTDSSPRVRPVPSLYSPQDQGPGLLEVEQQDVAQAEPGATDSFSAPEPRTSASPGVRRSDRRQKEEDPSHGRVAPAPSTAERKSVPPPVPQLSTIKAPAALPAGPENRRDSRPLRSKATKGSLPGEVQRETVTRNFEVSRDFARRSTEQPDMPLGRVSADEDLQSREPAGTEEPATAARPPPTVSIGRIDIVVAPPPVPAPPRSDPRTRGFASYAALRRGLRR